MPGAGPMSFGPASQRVETAPQGLDPETKGNLLRILRGATDEVFPVAGIEERVDKLPKSRRIAVTCSPTKGLDATLQLSERLTALGFTVVPHISARLVLDEAHLTRIVDRLSAMGSEDIFVIGGDSSAPLGRFSSTLQLLTALRDIGGPFREIGVAAYPEGHPVIHAEVLQRALYDKQPLATYMVTQMCFDPKRIITWIATARSQGIRLPVHLGLPGAVKTSKLLRFSLRVGVGESMRFVTKHGNLITRLVKPDGYNHDALATRLAPYLGDNRLDIHGLHFYTFNEVQATEKWREQMVTALVATEGEE